MRVSGGPDLQALLSQMRALGLTPVLLTGDNAAVARQIAAEVGIDEVIAEVLPTAKADVVAGLQARGKTVAMVGDGVNDAAALRAADVSMAPSSASDVGRSAADFVFLSRSLTVVRVPRHCLSPTVLKRTWLRLRSPRTLTPSRIRA